MYSTATISIFNQPSLATRPESTSGWGRPHLTIPQQREKPILHQSADEVTRLSGLRTPPTDDMGTTYQVPNLSSRETRLPHHHSAFISTSNDRTKLTLSNATHERPLKYPVASEQTLGQPRPAPAASSSQLAVSRHSTRPSTPQSGPIMPKEQSTATRDATMVLHSLQIPACISSRGGNLADFAAQVTCLFWFESIKTLETAENVRTLSPTAPVGRLTENAVPISGFKKWVQTVLSTTQVTQNVILLALLFVYRLKMANPNVRGRPGSEYRLLTVALMLGNKFLDDNTYTNKTWAEVSGISVGEIHVMEVEFLSNMRYSLLVSKDQWEEWLVKLAKFWEYCDRTQRAPTSPLIASSPSHRNPFVSYPSSPTGTQTQPRTSLLPTHQDTHTYSPVANSYHNGASQAWQAAYSAGNAVSPLALKPDLHNHRKRSMAEEDPTEPPAKRVSRQPAHTQPQPQVQPVQRAVPTAVSELTRVSVPNLTINTNNVGSLPPNVAHSTGVNNYAPQQASGLSLPPLVPGVRAMATVYPTTTTGLAPQAPYPSTGGSQIPTSTMPLGTPTTYPPTAYGTPTKRLSPQSALTPATAGYGSSPLGESFPLHAMTPLGNMGTASGVHTPISHSPSIYLQQRPSPYKPVRHVNTLLYPPPSAFLHEYHISNAVPPAQMHYQPIGRRNEYRTGIVPEFALAGTAVYPTGRHHGLTPPAQAVAHLAHGGQPAQRQFVPAVERPY